MMGLIDACDVMPAKAGTPLFRNEFIVQNCAPVFARVPVLNFNMELGV